MKYLIILIPFLCHADDKLIKDYCKNEYEKCQECMNISNVPSEFYFYLGKYCAYQEIELICDKY